jgi:hypothetical protein
MPSTEERMLTPLGALKLTLLLDSSLSSLSSLLLLPPPLCLSGRRRPLPFAC